MDENIIRINSNTWRIEDGFVRAFLLTGSERAMLIDSGVSGMDVKSIAEQLTSLPLMLLNTHGDGDHSAGNAKFSEFYMDEKDYVNCNLARKCPDSKLIPLSDGMIIDLGERELEIISIPGHTWGSVAILDKGGRALFPGDTVQNRHVYMFGRHRAPELYSAALEKLMARSAEYDVIYPSHGTPELSPEFTNVLYSAWQSVLDGSAESHPEDVHGNMIKCYDFDSCGFYC